MFIPSSYGDLSIQQGFNLFGEPDFSFPERVACSVIRLIGTAGKTSVRTDSSASRGNAEEIVADARILFPPDVNISTGDRFQIAGFTLRIASIHPRFNVMGALDHYDVTLEKWIGK